MKKKVLILITLFFTIILASCFLSSTYTITYITNSDYQMDSVTVKANEAFMPTEVPIKDGYEFKGWYLDKDCLYPFSFNAGTSKDIILYAKWEKHTFTEEEIKEYVESILLLNDIVLADKETINKIVLDLLLENDLVDEDLIINHLINSIDVAKLFNDKITNTIKNINSSVVMISILDKGYIVGGGSGVIYKRIDDTYYVITNEHVIRDTKGSDLQITLFTENGEININSVRINGHNKNHDLAVLTFTTNVNLNVIEFASMDQLNQGDLVIAIGSPFDLPNTVTLGVISALNRYLEHEENMFTLMIQHTAPINSGNSGGALINIDGKLVGINSLSYVDENVGDGVESIHFAIQIDIVKTIIPQLE